MGRQAQMMAEPAWTSDHWAAEVKLTVHEREQIMVILIDASIEGKGEIGERRRGGLLGASLRQMRRGRVRVEQRGEDEEDTYRNVRRPDG